MLDVPGHTEMNEEVPPALELENQILASPANGDDALPFESLGDGLRRLGPCEPWVDDLDAFERPPLEARSQPRTDRLHLG